MKSNKLPTLIIFILAFLLLACGSEDLLTAFSPKTPTPTFVLAKFTTTTATPIPANPSTAAPTQSATPPQLLSSIPETPPPFDMPPATETLTIEQNSPEPTSTPAKPTATPTITPTSPPPTATPTETPSPTPAPLSGRLAFPIDDGAGHYDVWVVELPDGEPFFVQARARQPSFSSNGQLLVNNQDSQYGEHIGLLDVNYTWLGLVSDSPYDSYPFWRSDGELYTFSNPQLLLDPLTGDPLSHVFVPCSMRRPSEEDDVYCRDIATGGKVAIGEFPVWTEDDRIAFFGFEGEDGIYVVSGASGLWNSRGGLGPPQLLVAGNGRPSDTHGFQVYFSAGSIDQNWEAYRIDLDGGNLTNLSNSPTSQDGLPAVSPDGNWVAFISDRDGRWNIWVTPSTGGEPAKLVDLSQINTNPSPWGRGDREWITERLSWGP